MKVFRLSGWLILLLLYLPETSAQFYNGHQMSFGKNRFSIMTTYGRFTVMKIMMFTLTKTARG